MYAFTFLEFIRASIHLIVFYVVLTFSYVGRFENYDGKKLLAVYSPVNTVSAEC